MKILIATPGYFPAKTYGGPPVSIKNFCDLLHSDIEMYIVTSNHEHGSDTVLENITDGWQKVGNAQVLYLAEKNKNIFTLEKIVKDIRPNWIYLNSLFDAKNVLPLLHIAKKFKIKVLLAPRGELCEGAFKKKYKKIPYILFLRSSFYIKNIMFQSTSKEETKAIKKYLGVQYNKISFLSNIPTIPLDRINRNIKKSGQAKFVFISRIHPKKNLKNAISYFKCIKGDVRFDIYGPIENQKYWEECLIEIKKLPDNIIVSYCGVLSHDQVHETFSKYDALVFPTLSENYGHVIAESLLVGTPAIISNQTPWNGINEAGVGAAIELENSAMFSKEIQKIIDMDNEKFDVISKKAVSFSMEKSNIKLLKEQYLEILKNGEN